MKIGVRFTALCAVGLLLAGCASQPVIPFDKATASDVKIIGVVTIAMPQQPSVRLASDIGQSFGLIGALVDAGMESSRNSDFWKEIDGNKNPPPATFTNDVIASLQARGFIAQTAAVIRKSDGFLKNYPSAGEAHVDAYLDLTFIGIGYGYIAAGIADSTPYRPFAYVNCRLVRASDGSVLMQDIVFYNLVNAVGGNVSGVTLSPDPAYTFKDFDTLKADPAKASEGLNDALHKTSDAIGDLMH